MRSILNFLFTLVLTIGCSSSFASIDDCKDTMADWLSDDLSVEKKEEFIDKFCPAFQGELKALVPCLDAVWGWTSSGDLSHKYEVAFLTCSSVSRKHFKSVESRTTKCLDGQWDKRSYIFDQNQRRIKTAEACSQELSGKKINSIKL